jgi:hypothetical protein
VKRLLPPFNQFVLETVWAMERMDA